MNFKNLLSPISLLTIFCSIASLFTFQASAQKLDTIITSNGELIPGKVQIQKNDENSSIKVVCLIEGEKYESNLVRYVIKDGARYANTQFIESSDKYMDKIRGLGFIQAWKTNLEVSIYKIIVFTTNKNSIEKGKYETVMFYGQGNKEVKFGNVENMSSDYNAIPEVMKYVNKKKRKDVIKNIALSMIFVSAGVATVGVYIDQPAVTYGAAGATVVSAVALLAVSIKADKNVSKAFDILGKGAVTNPDAIVHYKKEYVKSKSGKIL